MILLLRENKQHLEQMEIELILYKIVVILQLEQLNHIPWYQTFHKISFKFPIQVQIYYKFKTNHKQAKAEFVEEKRDRMAINHLNLFYNHERAIICPTLKLKILNLS